MRKILFVLCCLLGTAGWSLAEKAVSRGEEMGVDHSRAGAVHGSPNLGRRVVAGLRNVPVSPAHFNCEKHCTPKNCKENQAIYDACTNEHAPQPCHKWLQNLCVNVRHPIQNDCTQCTQQKCSDLDAQKSCAIQCRNQAIFAQCLMAVPHVDYRDSKQVVAKEMLDHIKFLRNLRGDFKNKYLKEVLDAAFKNLEFLNAPQQMQPVKIAPNNMNPITPEERENMTRLVNHYEALYNAIEHKFQPSVVRNPFGGAPQSRLTPQQRQQLQQARAGDFDFSMGIQDFRDVQVPMETVSDAKNLLRSLEDGLHRSCFGPAKRIPNAAH